MDVLDEILSSLRLAGGVVVDGEFSGDFCVAAEFTPAHFAPFYPVPDKVMSYHYVRSGKLLVEVDGMAPVTLEAGSVAILPRNDPHRLASRVGIPPAAAGDISRITADGVHQVSAGTGGDKAEVWCGFLETAKTSEHPLLDALPPLLTLKVVGGEAEWLDTSMRFLAEQQPSSDIVAKLAELFVSQAIREYVERLPAGASGWLRGLTDPAVTKALSIIHTRFAEELDVEGLAREAGVSRTILGEKFAELIGEPPMRYCARWRMRMAANMLRDGRQSTANIAYSVGFNSEAAFNRAFKREYGVPPATWRKREEAQRLATSARVLPLPAQHVNYALAPDGTRLAWSEVGDGPPLVKTANWLNHLEFDFESPIWQGWIKELAADFRLIRYDERGNGLSDWNAPELSLEAFVDDLACVVDAAGIEKFDLLAISQGAAVAIAYSLKYPERVRRIILLGGYACGWRARGDNEEIARREAMLTLTELGWGKDNPAYRQIFTSFYVPGANAEQTGWFNELQRRSTSPEIAVKLMRALSTIDVRHLLEFVRHPTLVLHARGDQAIPFEQGEMLAHSIPGARFVPLDSDNHILLENEPAFRRFLDELRDFLGEAEPRIEAPAVAARGRESGDEIRTCRASDGTKIAYAVSGSGFPLVKAQNWITNLHTDRTNPSYRHWIAEGSRSNRFVRSDMRGFGMSEPDPAVFNFEAMVGDLAAVVDDADLGEFDLLGVAHGAPIAMAYAARHPQRVRKMVLVNSFAAGWRVRADPEEIAWRNSLMEMNQREWAFRRSLLGEMFLTLYFPTADQELIDWHNRHFGELGPVPRLQEMIEVAADIDVRDQLAKIRAKTLVCHSRQDGNAPLLTGRAVADGIEDARFVELDSANHILLGNEPAWPEFVREMRDFLRGSEAVVLAHSGATER
ncbi:MAG TPA: alpha/beta fold hydrolase [Sphingomicrobium sp.]|jgi:pimeloyl-ACP methyl ester carboxylesterase/AraC-like DNA-binding protein|nr:alpha/beta fold hydrolase [Sphingomicrobium sp.]